MKTTHLLIATVSVALVSGTIHAQPQQGRPDEAPQEPIPLEADWLREIGWRSIGPANMSGRCVSIAVNENDPMNYWIGTASGGLLKTTNGGITYEHQFDDQETVSIGHVAVSRSNPEIVWVGTGEANPRNSVSYGNGVYKSTDGGATWTHMGLDESFQTGRIAIHPTNPDIVYVGALGRLYGPNEDRGLYKTTDGGKTWEKILYIDEKTGVIDIDMHPNDPETLIVATYERERDLFDTNDPSKKFGPGSGLHKTTDGGKTWKKLIEGLPTVNLGRIGVDWYRKDPNIIYAVIESERIARLADEVGYMGVSGEDAELGARLTNIAEGGPAEAATLRQGDIVISINDEKVGSYRDLLAITRRYKAGETITVEYARNRDFMIAEVVLAPRPEDSRREEPFSGGLGGQRENVQEEQGLDAWQTGGIYRSEDGGETWTRINSLNPRPMYYSQIRVDPSDDKYIYVCGTQLYRSDDGGKTFRDDGGRGGVHVDHHALWINPGDGRHMILGNDGGIYVTHDRMENWDHHNHVAIGQFYHVTTDPRPLYRVYGGLQDNGTWGGPNLTRDGSGAINPDWLSIGGGDGFVCQVDVNDPDLIYFESQNGGMGRRNLRTGERASIRPRAPRGVRYRFNWKTPFILSNHNSRIFYTAGNYVFRSLDRGDNLQIISPEITRTENGSGSSIAESPRDPNVLYVGTDDGAFWVTQDGGHSWTNLYGGPEETVETDTPETRETTDQASRQAAMLQQMMSRLDRNSDGKLQRDEVPERMRGVFERFDLNGDGAIDQDEIRQVASQPAMPAADPVTGTWNARLRGEGVPEGTQEFQIVLELHEGNVVRGTLQSQTMRGTEEDGTFNPENGELSLRFEDEAGAVMLTGVVRNDTMSGTLEVAGGLLQIPFDARRGTGPATEPQPEQQPQAPPEPEEPAPAADPVTGSWTGELLSEQMPPEMRAFTLQLTLKDGAVTGTASSAQGDAELRNGTFNAETGELKGTLIAPDDAFEMLFEAKVSGEEMTGSISSPDGSISVPFEAKKGEVRVFALRPVWTEFEEFVFFLADPVSGEWQGRFVSDQFEAEFSMTLRLGEGGVVTGTFTSRFNEGDISSGSFNVDTNTLSITVPGQRGDSTIEGTIENGTLRGSLSAGGGQFSIDIEATRTRAFEESTPQQADEPQASAPAPRTTGSLRELLPKPMNVSSIEASRFADGRVYVAFDGHRSDLDDPFIFMSEDYGQTWTSIRANLPRGSTRVLREDRRNPNVLYVGTEFGAWVSVDRGRSWTSFNQGDLPTVAVHELAQHPTLGDIVAATHGRALWIADVTPLRQMSADTVGASAHLYEPAVAIYWRREPSRGSSGLRAFEGENPPFGAQIFYTLGRRAQSISLSIEDAEGTTIRELEVRPEPGFHRVDWDLRTEGQQTQRGRRGGRPVDPGQYRVVLVVDGQRTTQPLRVINDPDFPTSPLDEEQALFEAEEEAAIEEGETAPERDTVVIH